MRLPFRPLAWMPPRIAALIYTVLLKPPPLRALAQFIIKRFIPPEIRIHDVDLVLNQDDAIVSGCLAMGCYETYELELFHSFLQPGMVVLDVGANIGLYASVAAKRVGPGGRVVAVEPEARNCDILRKTVDRNGFKNLAVVQAAVSDRTGPGELFLCATNKADHRIYGSPKARTVVKVDFIRLDDLAAQQGLASVDVVKVDIQGAESIAFEGMTEILARNRGVRVLIEFWPWGIIQTGYKPSDLLRRIRGLGFEIRQIDGDRRAVTLVHDDAALASQDLERQHTNLLLTRPSA
ncbi:MAG: FkbM family methyltransferase [Planctomycetota bacterium]|nr:FkbM family methyltransferase [Planctomycetota bacterium]